jgi:hypothetical protein
MSLSLLASRYFFRLCFPFISHPILPHLTSSILSYNLATRMLHFPPNSGLNLSAQRANCQILRDEFRTPEEDVGLFGAALTTHHIGRHLIARDEVGSTMDLAHREAMEGAPHGTVVIAKKQSTGFV